MDLNVQQMAVIDHLIDMKRKKPEKYKQYLEDIEGVMRDLLEVMRRSMP
jgi:hypothetical protein